MSASLRIRAAAERERRRRQQQKDNPTFHYDHPADFIEAEIYDPDSSGRLALHPEQRAVLEAMSARDDAGNFRHSLWLYSAPKKSSKTTIGAGIALWQAWQVPRGEIYIIGNDQKQADSRMSEIIRFSILNNPRMKGRARITQSSYKIVLDNGTRIESIPVDPKGESGMNPTGLFWTEAWGAMGKAAELLWSEATLSPTRAGQSFKFVESYAGYNGESTVLERLYEGVIKRGAAHARVPELYINGASIGYWCTRRYLPWQQNPAYYAQEALSKTPSEFERQHENKWQSSTQAFIPIEWWDACKGDVTPPARTDVVVAVDAAVSGDCFAIVVVGKIGGVLTVLRTYIWTPPANGQIDFSEPEQTIRDLASEFWVLEVAYDEYQLADMMQRLRREGIHCKAFSQGTDRLVADKKLHDAIRDGRLAHDGDAKLREHVQNANKKEEADGARLRIVKRVETSKIDAVVALSMAHERASVLNL